MVSKVRPRVPDRIITKVLKKMQPLPEYANLFKEQSPLDKKKEPDVLSQIYKEIYRYFGHSRMSIGTLRVLKILNEDFLTKREVADE